MLQRQIMFKQLQELQRKQQLQELGNNRNQNFGQYSPTLNETPVQDRSRMFMVGNMQMLQHGGPNEPVLSQNHNRVPQFDMTSYETHGPNSGDNLNQYSHLQGASNLSVNPLVKNQSGFDTSFMSQQHNLLSDLSNQDSNLFGQVPAGAFNSEDLSCNYSTHGFQENASFTESEKGNENASSLDPLEQEILYNTDDNSWETAFSRVGKMGSGGVESKVETPSLQIGSWSALMQSAVAESSSSDAGIQEEWSGLSFQNPEPLTDTEKLQSDWVDRNLQNDSSPSSKPEKLFPNINSFTNLQQPSQYIRHEEYHLKSSHANMQHSPRNTSQLVENTSQQVFQGYLTSENILPGELNGSPNNDAHHPNDNRPSNNDNQPSNNLSGYAFGGSSWIHGSTSGHLSSIQKKYDQANQMNVAPISVSTGEIVSAPSDSVVELLNKEDTSNDQTPAKQSSSKVSIHRELPNSPDFGFSMGPTDHPQTPQSHSFSPSFSGNSGATSLHIMSDYMKNLHPAPSASNHNTTQFPSYSAVYPPGNSELKISDSSQSEFPILENIPEIKPSLTPDMLQHSGFPMALPNPGPENHHTFRHDQQPEKGNSAQDELTEMNNSTSLSRHTLHLEANAVDSDSFPSNLHNQGLNQVEVENRIHSFPTRDMGAFPHSSNQNYSPLHHALSTRNAGSDNVNNQHSVANARKLLLSGLQSGVKGSQLNEFWSGTASSISYNQNPLQTNNSSPTYQHISPQMAPSWFKNYETMKAGKVLPMYDSRAPTNVAQSFGEASLGNLPESSLTTQVNFSNTNQIHAASISMADSSVASKQLNLPSVLPSDTTYGNLVSVPKKRKLTMLDMIPWHKEVNHEQSRLQDISSAEYLWAEASNRKPVEATNEAELVEGLLPVNRAKRRLVSTTQLMQQVFRPQPVFILCSDATPNCDCVAYLAARLALGDAWSLTAQFQSETNNMSPDELKASKRTKASGFSKVVDAFINRVKKIEADLSSLDRSLSFVDIKFEAQELEKFSTINRFAKFHIRSHTIKADPSPSSGTTALLKNLQKYVVPVPMPKIVPEGQECISL